MAGHAVRWVVALLALAAVLAVELTLLRDQLTRDLELLGKAGRAATGAPVVNPAPPVARRLPAAAGAVTGVNVRAVGSCAAGTPCQVRVLVRLLPDTQPTRVTWDFEIVDRCTAAVRHGAGGTVPVGPGGDGVALVDTVTLPAGGALAVIAVTAEPAAAASDPLLVPVRATC